MRIFPHIVTSGLKVYHKRIFFVHRNLLFLMSCWMMKMWCRCRLHQTQGNTGTWLVTIFPTMQIILLCSSVIVFISISRFFVGSDERIWSPNSSLWTFFWREKYLVGEGMLRPPPHNSLWAIIWTLLLVLLAICSGYRWCPPFTYVKSFALWLGAAAAFSTDFCHTFSCGKI